MNKVYYISSNDSLYHHGIKGQKWGIRRYQNEDGSLTPEGERRYGTVDNMNRTRSRNKKIAIGVGAAAAVAGTAYLVGKNRKLKRTNSALGKDNDALYDAAKKLADRNKGLKGENARLKDSLNIWNDKLIGSETELNNLRKQNAGLIDKLSDSKKTINDLKVDNEKHKTIFQQMINKLQGTANIENNRRTNISIGKKKTSAYESAMKGKGWTKKFIEKGDDITISRAGKTSNLGIAAKRTAVWINELGEQILYGK